MSAISPECRVAMRALRRAKQDEMLGDEDEMCKPPTSVATAVSAVATDATDADAHAVTVGTGAGSSVSSTMVRDTTLSIKLADLDEHYTLRPSRERSLLETEAAIAAVLASSGCADVDAEGVGGKERDLQPDSGGCGSLAAELVTALFKVKRRLCGQSSRALAFKTAIAISVEYLIAFPSRLFKAVGTAHGCCKQEASFIFRVFKLVIESRVSKRRGFVQSLAATP